MKPFYIGPESLTADSRFTLGPAPELDKLQVGCGFNSTGIASAGSNG